MDDKDYINDLLYKAYNSKENISKNKEIYSKCRQDVISFADKYNIDLTDFDEFFCIKKTEDKETFSLHTLKTKYPDIFSYVMDYIKDTNYEAYNECKIVRPSGYYFKKVNRDGM